MARRLELTSRCLGPFVLYMIISELFTCLQQHHSFSSHSFSQMAIKRERINTSEKFRAKFLAWLGNKQGATGMHQFLTDHISKLQGQQAK